MSQREYQAKRASGQQSARKEPTRKKSRKGRGKKGSVLPGVLITLVMAVVMLCFFAFIVKTGFLPAKLMVVLAVVLLALTALIGWLTVRTPKSRRFRAGVIGSLVLCALLLLVSFYVARGISTLNSITGKDSQSAHIGIFVLADDPAQELGDMADYTFGVLSLLDRENINDSIEQMEDALGGSVAIAECGGLTELMDALFSGEVGAILLNSAYLDVIADMDGYKDVNSRIREVTNFTVESSISGTEYDEEDKIITLYLSGIDSRNGLVAKSRSDTNIIATVNLETHQVLLLSTPRDYFIPLSISDGKRDKLTHAGIYGVDCSIESLEMFYGIDIDYYFRVNFSGFEDIVNALGGITVYSDYDFSSSISKGDTGTLYTYKKGYNDLNGIEALYFARERYSFKEGDAQRARNQMAVIKAIVNKALSPEILTSYLSLLNAVEGSFETSVPYDLIASLVRRQLDEGGGWNIVTYAPTGTDGKEVPYSMSQKAYVTIPDETTVEYAKQLMERIRNGEVLTQEMIDGE